MPQFAEGFSLDLAYALAGNAELLPHLFERTALAIAQPKAPLDDIAFAVAQAIEHFLHLLAQQLQRGSVDRAGDGLILDEVAQRGILLGAYRRFEAHRLLRD